MCSDFYRFHHRNRSECKLEVMGEWVEGNIRQMYLFGEACMLFFSNLFILFSNLFILFLVNFDSFLKKKIMVAHAVFWQNKLLNSD